MPISVKKASNSKKSVNARKSSKSTAEAAAVSKSTVVPPHRSGLEVGAKAPEFFAAATVLGQISSSKLKGHPFILYFYPKDDTSGCTAQACAFEEALPQLSKLGVQVIGVSKDSLKSHEKFALKYNLTFPLVSDEQVDLAEKFGVWKQKSMYGRSYMGVERSTFLVDAKGYIRALWLKVSVPGHVDQVRKAISEL